VTLLKSTHFCVFKTNFDTPRGLDNAQLEVPADTSVLNFWIFRFINAWLRLQEPSILQRLSLIEPDDWKGTSGVEITPQG
jgi:hypothetical protein